jgi:mono/diheme cytochrome c family protein
MINKPLVTAIVVAGFGLVGLSGEQAAAPAVYTAAQAAAGRKAFQSVCFNCHQASLAGRKGEAGELPPLASLPPGMQADIVTAGGKIPPLAGDAFMARWAGRTTADLSRRIKDASPFLKQADPLLAEDTDENAYLNLTAYILQANGAQPGTQELTKDTAVVIRTITTR